MSSAVVSNQNLTDFSVINAVVSASAVGEVLYRNPEVVQQAEFNSIVSPPSAIVLASASAQVYSLTTEDIARAVMANRVLSLTGVGAVALNLGSSAVALISLLNLSTDHRFVDLHFCNGASSSTENSTVTTTLASGSTGITLGATTLFTAGAVSRSNVIRVEWTSATTVTVTTGTAKVL
jgi:hypothetical protein